MTGASTGIGWFAVPLAIIAGAFRGGTPFLFVSLGECLTEKSGKINLGLEGIGGAYLSLYYPGSWNERVSSGQGMIAVALVIFARWNPIHCLWASLLFGGAQALGPALQSVGVTSYYYLFNVSLFILTLAVMILTCSNKRALSGVPGALTDRT
jgi:ABC-type uncharacterized transport system permease subunit